MHEDCLRVIYSNYYKLFVNFTVHTLENYVFKMVTSQQQAKIGLVWS